MYGLMTTVKSHSGDNSIANGQGAMARAPAKIVCLHRDPLETEFA